MMQAAEVLPLFQIHKKEKNRNENFKTLNLKAILIALCLPLLGSTDSEEKTEPRDKKNAGCRSQSEIIPIMVFSLTQRYAPTIYRIPNTQCELFFYYPCPIKPVFSQNILL